MASHEAGESARPRQAAQTLFIELEASGEGAGAAAIDEAESPAGDSDDGKTGMPARGAARTRAMRAAGPPTPTPIRSLIAEAARVDDDVQTAARTEGAADNAPTEGAHRPGDDGAGALADGRHSQGDSRGLRGRGRRGARGSGPGSPGGSAAGAGHAPASARLLARSARCNDLFPYRASADSARVMLEVDVRPDGTPERARVLAATPQGEGFAPAAHLCAKRLRFAPARDDMGRAVASLARVRLGFVRN